MTRDITFTKVVGAGNDFVIVDNRRGTLRGLPQLARQFCDRRTGIGADGLMLVERSRRADIRMRIFNPDGSEPEMCGNGARCFALYATAEGLAPASMRLDTKAGVLTATVRGGRARLEMPRPTDFEELLLAVNGRRMRAFAVRIGNPHVVVPVRGIARYDVRGIGHAIRWHRRFAPEGTNVNFIQPGRRETILRTFERGVEGETLACGTGATASAAVMRRYLRGPSMAVLRTRSGDALRVQLDVDDNEIQRAFLEGPARIVFTGRFPARTS